MNTATNHSFKVIVSAKRRGDPTDHWNNKAVAIQSHWDRGSEEEKFEVLSAIRKIYNPDERGDIRGRTAQRSYQIGLSEGFTALQYHYKDAPQVQTVIITPLGGYSRRASVPQKIS